jgi:hypothetical protein
MGKLPTANGQRNSKFQGSASGNGGDRVLPLPLAGSERRGRGGKRFKGCKGKGWRIRFAGEGIEGRKPRLGGRGSIKNCQQAGLATCLKHVTLYSLNSENRHLLNVVTKRGNIRSTGVGKPAKHLTQLHAKHRTPCPFKG